MPGPGIAFPPERITRRRLLGCLGCAVLTGCARTGKGDDTADSGRVDTGTADTAPTDTAPTDTAPTDTGTADTGTAATCGDDGRSVEGWVELPLADWPELAEPGGYAYVEVPERLLQAIVAHTDPGCFVALWRICTHGACETEWDATAQAAVCPCHGSVFAADGAVLEGPATAPLRAFRAIGRGGSVWVER